MKFKYKGKEWYQGELVLVTLSNGSVVPQFLEYINEGSDIPIKTTTALNMDNTNWHKDMKKYDNPTEYTVAEFDDHVYILGQPYQFSDDRRIWITGIFDSFDDVNGWSFHKKGGGWYNHIRDIPEVEEGEIEEVKEITITVPKDKCEFVEWLLEKIEVK